MEKLLISALSVSSSQQELEALRVQIPTSESLSRRVLHVYGFVLESQSRIEESLL